MNHPSPWFEPNWPKVEGVTALSTCRGDKQSTGNSQAPFEYFNLGLHVGDDPQVVISNRALLPTPNQPFWLEQTHSNIAIDLASYPDINPDADVTQLPKADASFTCQALKVASVMTADCLPVLMAEKRGRAVAAIHCGWRSLASNIIENTLVQLNNQLQSQFGDFQVWLGPCIGPSAFEVGEDVKAAFTALDSRNVKAFAIHQHAAEQGKYLADLQQLACNQLLALGVTDIYRNSDCTYQLSNQYFSYRRDGKTGRMASLIWIE
ncbi:peptidoglycan editing factor PgeF [Catenovulum sp. SM1970]|uniref:peptidoglycan editing factor PgeF n=1 Tax=Marinifaba aquimaris TaxID=2741323 RepID=UPI001574726B|nr:peptidoglycan editing factor PgeF [Marinifaba aquimaris]NTS78323.1 peptidoglycan editing factor PgeF [Marinifaba aquimaris]